MSNIPQVENGEIALSVRGKINKAIAEANKVDSIVPSAEAARDAAISAAGEATNAKTAAVAAADSAVAAADSAVAAADSAEEDAVIAADAANALTNFDVNGITVLTQAEYDAIITPDPETLYVIKEAE